MKTKWIFTLLLFSFTLLGATAQSKEKVILDTDMVEIFDDGIALMMLQLDPNIDLVGVTTVTGNSWVTEGTAYALRQLEAINSTHIPVAIGAEFPLRPHRHAAMSNERPLYGIGHDLWAGSFSHPAPESWQAFYQQMYGEEPKIQPIKQHAVEFLIDQIRCNPGEITIAAIGTCTNLALAVRIAPDIIPLVKRIIYMGGSFFQQGNVTPTAEFNWWADPEAARICVGSPFKEQIVVGLDVCEKITFKKTEYEKIRQIVKNPIITDMLNRNVLVRLFENDADYTHYIWDIIVAAILMDPTLVTAEVTYPIDISTDFGFSYGQSMAYQTQAPIGAQKARIITEVDKDRLWKIIYEYCEKF